MPPNSQNQNNDSSQDSDSDQDNSNANTDWWGDSSVGYQIVTKELKENPNPDE